MKAVILAGGLGTRISEETNLKPKPMVEIGGKPILWHILKIYSSYGINEFIICCGYKGYVIKEYFSNYFLHMSDVTFNMKDNKMVVHHKSVEPWIVTLVDTGEDTQTGGRIKRIKEFISDEDFCLTYGDGLSNVDISKLVKQHKNSNCLVTMTAVKPPGRFGSLSLDGNYITEFIEKPDGDGIGGWINGGFFVLNRKIFDFIEGDPTVWEGGPLKDIAKIGKLQAYFHSDFWQPMDTLRDKVYLEKLWDDKDTPWKNWNE
jgi:glucose-1-phosphate cytidylyltransferase